MRNPPDPRSSTRQSPSVFSSCPCPCPTSSVFEICVLRVICGSTLLPHPVAHAPGSPITGALPDDQDGAEADGVGGGVGGVAAAGGAAAVGGEHAPAPAADGLERPALRPLRVFARAFEVVVVVEPVLYPLLHVAVH